MNDRGEYGHGHWGHTTPIYPGQPFHPSSGYAVGAAGIEPRYAARRRAVQAIFNLHDQVRAPFYVYSENDGTTGALAAASEAEAMRFYKEAARLPGSSYAAVFNAGGEGWPDPAHETYHGGVAVSGDPGNVLSIPTAGRTYEEIFAAQNNALTRARGFDASAALKIPRSTNEDVRALTSYWMKALQDTKHAKSSPALWALLAGPAALFATSSFEPPPGDLGGFVRAAKLWAAAVADVDVLAQGDDSATYVKNAEFWHALHTLAVELAVLMEAPTSFDIALHSTLHYIKHPGEGLERTWDAAKNEVPKIAWGIGKYLLIGGAIIGGGILLNTALNRRK
jgi:hypothetical protein